MFSLCREFEELNLDEKTDISRASKDNLGSSSTGSVAVKRSVYNYHDVYARLMQNCQLSLLNKEIMDRVHAPFIDLPRQLLDSISCQSYDIKMGMGFRFLPGQSEFLLQELKLPESFDRLAFIKDNLGLSYHSAPLNGEIMFSYCRSGVGLRGLVTEGSSYQKVLVEVITYYSGRYGRFFILVGLGLGCTVWYGYAPGSPLHVYDMSLFGPMESYEPFLDMEYSRPGFKKVSILEKNDIVSASVETAFNKEPPFADIEVPASGPVLKAVCLGVMVAFFLAVGLIPNDCGEIAAQFNTMIGIGTITTRSLSTHTNDLSTSSDISQFCTASFLSYTIKFLYEKDPRAFDLDELAVHRILEQVENGTYRNKPFLSLLCAPGEHQQYCTTYKISVISKPGWKIVILPGDTDLLVYTAIAFLLNRILLRNSNIKGILITDEQFYSELITTNNVKCLYRLDLTKTLTG